MNTKKADIFRKCFNFNNKINNIKNMQQKIQFNNNNNNNNNNEFNKISNIFIYSYMQNIISKSKKKFLIKASENKKRYLISDSNSVLKKNFSQEFLISTFSIPHPNKSKTGSEDSLLIYKR